MIILSAHILGIALSAVSSSGVVIILNNKEFENTYLSANISTFHIAVYVIDNVFWAKYRYKCLKYELIKYPACISVTVAVKCVPLSTFLNDV